MNISHEKYRIKDRAMFWVSKDGSCE